MYIHLQLNLTAKEKSYICLNNLIKLVVFNLIRKKMPRERLPKNQRPPPEEEQSLNTQPQQQSQDQRQEQDPNSHQNNNDPIHLLLEFLRQRTQNPQPREERPLVRQTQTTVTFKSFKSLNPPEFKGTTNPVEARIWLREIEKTFEIVGVE